VKEPIVSDSTCLIGLERINLLTILPEVFETVTIPSRVEEEFGRSFPWLKVENPSDTSLIASLNSEIHLGEAQTIALAHAKSSLVLLDERRARSVARRLRLRMIGTIGTLIIAKQRRIIPKVGPVLDQLELKNFYIGDELKNEALRIAGE
jgi:predicted nucleic acid-binding protein